MTSQARIDFVNKYNNLVQEITSGTGLFPEVVLSQAIIESQENGEIPGTDLAKNYNNFFGIKAGSGWNGDSVNMNTHEVVDNSLVSTSSNFRVYATPEDSFRDFVKFLQGNPRYENVFKAQSVEDQAQALQDAGYSTSPTYADLISSVSDSISEYITPLNVVLGALILGGLFFGFYYFLKHE